MKTSAVQKAKPEIKEDNELWESFKNASMDCNIIEVDDKTRKELYLKFIEKVLNIRLTEEFRKQRQKYTVRKTSEKKLNVSTRNEWKIAGFSKKEKGAPNIIKILNGWYVNLIQLGIRVPTNVQK